MKKNLKNLACFLLIIFTTGYFAFGQAGPKWRWARIGTDATVDLSISDTLGNTYVFGKFATPEFSIGSTKTIGLSTGESNSLYLAKFSSAGDILWLKSITGFDPATVLKPVKISVNENGNISLLGVAYNTTELRIDNNVVKFSNTNEQMFVAKFHKAGRLLWARIVQTIGSQGALISGNDMIMNNNGEVFVTGHFIADTAIFNLKTITGHSVDPLFFLVKYNAIGLVDWVTTCQYDPKGDNASITGQKIALDNSGDIILAGQYAGFRSFIFLEDTLYSNGGADIFLARYSPEGFPKWVRKIYGKFDELPEQLMVSSSGMIIIAGLFNSGVLRIIEHTLNNSSSAYDLFVAGISPEGDVKWAVNVENRLATLDFSGEKVILHIDEKPDIYIATLFQGAEVFTDAFRQINAEPGTPDLLFFKLGGETGVPIWTKSAAGLGNNWLNSVAYDRFSNLYFATNLESENLLSGTNIVKDTIGYGGSYIAKINRLGNVGFIKPLLNRDSNSTIDIKTLSLDFFGNLYVSGTFRGTEMYLDDLPMNMLNPGIYTAKYAYVTNISGHIRQSDETPVTEGYVKIYGFSRFQRSPVSDSVDINSDGTYIFHNIPLGRYILSAKPRIIGYPNSTPTYYSNAGYWEDAIPITVSNTLPITDINITINMPVISGTNLLGGSIFETDTLSIFKSSSGILKKPSRAVSVVLINRKKSTGGDVVAVVVTDDYGDFIISNVPDGWYTILADIPGIPHNSTYDVYVTGGQYIGNLYYELGLEEIFAVNESTNVQELEQKKTGLILYPNPCKTNLNIILNYYMPASGVMTVDLFSVTGQRMQTYVMNNPESVNSLDITNLQPGVYLIQIEYSGVKYFEKMLKQ